MIKPSSIESTPPRMVQTLISAAVRKIFGARTNSEFSEHLVTQASDRVFLHQKIMNNFGTKLLGSVLMSAMNSSQVPMLQTDTDKQW